MRSWFQQLRGTERRRATRRLSPPLAVYYWDGATPAAHEVQDVSLTGMYLATEQRWYPNTLIRMTVVRTQKTEADPDRAIEVTARMIRAGSDGVALAFVVPESKQYYAPGSSFPPAANRETLREFLTRAQSDHRSHERAHDQGELEALSDA